MKVLSFGLAREIRYNTRRVEIEEDSGRLGGPGESVNSRRGLEVRDEGMEKGMATAAEGGLVGVGNLCDIACGYTRTADAAAGVGGAEQRCK
jgi:hypothetical protein